MLCGISAVLGILELVQTPLQFFASTKPKVEKMRWKQFLDRILDRNLTHTNYPFFTSPFLKVLFLCPKSFRTIDTEIQTLLWFFYTTIFLNFCANLLSINPEFPPFFNLFYQFSQLFYLNLKPTVRIWKILAVLRLALVWVCGVRCDRYVASLKFQSRFF